MKRIDTLGSCLNYAQFGCFWRKRVNKHETYDRHIDTLGSRLNYAQFGCFWSKKGELRYGP